MTEKEIINSAVEARIAAGISQYEMAKICGMHQPSVARFEKNKHSPQLNTLLRYLKPMGYTLNIVKEECND